MKLHIFNPENDLALADGNANYCPPPAACAIASDLAVLPLWYAPEGDCVLLPGEQDLEFCKKMQELFSLAQPFEPAMLGGVEGCVPWGWSAQMKRRLRAMGVEEGVLPCDAFLDDVRRLSNRRCAIELLSTLVAAGVETAHKPLYFTSMDDVKTFVESMPRSVIKAPWSGSGRGIAWGIGRLEVPVEHFCKGVIRRQGGVVCEPFLDKVVDFAMEFFVSGGAVAFAGYSLFKCDGGAYSGNILATDDAIENFLAGFVGREALSAVKEQLCLQLERLLCPVGYTGYLGVDMLVYRRGEGFALYPCVELNLRMNMGALSRVFYDRFVQPGCVGHFYVANFRGEGEALALHEGNKVSAPFVVRDGRLERGYMNLSPVSRESKYLAYVFVEENETSLASLYAGE